jgi:methionine-rich copper-binding protein CopC
MGDMGRRPPLAARQWLLAVCLAGLLAVASVAGATAHADLIASEPAAGSTVAGSPGTIRLSFSQPLESASSLQLFTGQFQPVTGLTTSVAGSELQAVVGKALAPATYTVQWSAATEDGHITEGSFQFAVAAASPSGSNRLAPLLAAVASIIGAGVALLAWALNRRQRL